MARELTIGSRTITDDSPCYVIAEVGHNHQGKLETAREMFAKAKECGAHAVKLQKRDNRALFTAELYNSPYHNENAYGKTYGEHREALEFGESEYKDLRALADELGVAMLATAFDFNSADFLAKLDLPAYKIASGDLTNIPLIKHVAGFGKPVLVSTGGGALADVERVYDAIMPINPALCLLQCTASYPAEPEQMNLRVIETYRKRFPDVVIGLSDHQNGIALAMVGFALGARVIEKHFTLNRAWRGTDHAFSLAPDGLRKMVRDLDRAHQALGDGDKRQLPCEKGPLFKMGKKLVAARPLAKGAILRAQDIAIKSPGDGMPPYLLDEVVGRALAKDLEQDEALSPDILLAP